MGQASGEAGLPRHAVNALRVELKEGTDSGPAAANSAGALALEPSREGGPRTFRNHGAEGPLSCQVF